MSGFRAVIAPKLVTFLLSSSRFIGPARYYIAARFSVFHCPFIAQSDRGDRSDVLKSKTRDGFYFFLSFEFGSEIRRRLVAREGEGSESSESETGNMARWGASNGEIFPKTSRCDPGHKSTDFHYFFQHSYLDRHLSGTVGRI